MLGAHGHKVEALQPSAARYGNYPPEVSGETIARDFRSAGLRIIGNLIEPVRLRQLRTSNGIPCQAPQNVQLLRSSREREATGTANKLRVIEDDVTIIFARPESVAPYRMINIDRHHLIWTDHRDVTAAERLMTIFGWQSVASAKPPDVAMEISGPLGRNASLTLPDTEDPNYEIKFGITDEAAGSLRKHEMDISVQGAIENLATTLMMAETASERPLRERFVDAYPVIALAVAAMEAPDPYIAPQPRVLNGAKRLLAAAFTRPVHQDLDI